MRLAFIPIAALALIVNLNSQAIDTPITSSNVDGIVSSFLTEQKPQFPDRTKQITEAKALDAQRLAEAQEAQRLALIAQQAKNAPQAPTIAQNTPVDSNSAKMFIYMKESGNNPNARNAGGCLGLGQACPGSKLLAVCPNLDYACQDAFFTNYALSRYGSWEGALAFWQGHHWW